MCYPETNLKTYLQFVAKQRSKHRNGTYEKGKMESESESADYEMEKIENRYFDINIIIISISSVDDINIINIIINI